MGKIKLGDSMTLLEVIEMYLPEKVSTLYGKHGTMEISDFLEGFKDSLDMNVEVDEDGYTYSMRDVGPETITSPTPFLKFINTKDSLPTDIEPEDFVY